MPFLAPAFGIFFPNLRGKAKKTLGTDDALVSFAEKRSMDWIKTKINHYDINQRQPSSQQRWT
jgi:hypothetical protein